MERIGASAPPNRGGDCHLPDRQTPVRREEEYIDLAAESDEDSVQESAQVLPNLPARASKPGNGHYFISRLETAYNQPIAEAPPPEKTQFESWKDLEEYLQEYSKVTFQSFRVRTNNRVEMRNKKIQVSKSKQPLVPAEWGYYAKTFVCTHAGTYKYRGFGKRKRQHSRAIQCEAQINACVKVVDLAIPSFALRITCARLEHNHPLSRHAHAQYPHNRMALEPDVAGVVNALLKAGATKKRILQYITENSSCAPTKQDVQNLMVRFRQLQGQHPQEEERGERSPEFEDDAVDSGDDQADEADQEANMSTAEDDQSTFHREEPVQQQVTTEVPTNMGRSAFSSDVRVQPPASPPSAVIETNNVHPIAALIASVHERLDSIQNMQQDMVRSMHGMQQAVEQSTEATRELQLALNKSNQVNAALLSFLERALQA